MKPLKNQWWIIGTILLQAIAIGTCLCACMHATVWFFAKHPEALSQHLPDMAELYLGSFRTYIWGTSVFRWILIFIPTLCATFSLLIVMTTKDNEKRFFRLLLVFIMIWCIFFIFVAWMIISFSLAVIPIYIDAAAS